MLIDTHSHINFNDFKDDWEEVIKRALVNNTWLINVGSQIDTSRRAVEMANNYKWGVFAAVGLHPIHLEDIQFKEEGKKIKSRSEKFDYDAYKKLALEEKVVGIGECGLDYYRLDSTNRQGKIAKQKVVFKQQLDLALDLNLPVIIHCREAHKDLLAILNEKIYQKVRGVVHCFTGSLEEARSYWQRGMMTSFTGIITFSDQFDEILREMPEDKFMVETDAPYLAPAPFRGKRNEPLYVRYIAEKIAAVRGVSPEKIAALTTKNAKRFFGIK